MEVRCRRFLVVTVCMLVLPTSGACIANGRFDVNDSVHLLPLEYEPSTILTFGGHEGRAFLTYGWGEHEEWGRWTIGPLAIVKFALSKTSMSRKRHTFFLGCHIFPPHFGQTIAVFLNGIRVGVITSKLAGARVFVIDFDGWLLKPDNEMYFVVKNPTSPIQLGLNNDHRQLGLGLVSFRIQPTL